MSDPASPLYRDPVDDIPDDLRDSLITITEHCACGSETTWAGPAVLCKNGYRQINTWRKFHRCNVEVAHATS